jgi:hypothetical protein
MSIGLLTAALLPVAAAVSAEPAIPAPAPVAITHPLGAIGSRPLFGRATLPESGLLMLIGTGLMGLAAVVRKATRT